MTARNERRRWLRASKAAARTNAKSGNQAAKALREAAVRSSRSADAKLVRDIRAAFEAIERQGLVE